MIGKTITITGDIVGSEPLHIEGSVKGSIRLESAYLNIGPEAKVQSNVIAREVVVRGSITGNVKMKSCCRIADPRCDARMRDAFSDEAYAQALPPSHSMVDTPAESQPENKEEVVETEGYTIRIITTETPDLTDWAVKELAPVLQKWYPKIVEMLPSEGYQAPKQVPIFFSQSTDGGATWIDLDPSQSLPYRHRRNVLAVCSRWRVASPSTAGWCNWLSEVAPRNASSAGRIHL